MPTMEDVDEQDEDGFNVIQVKSNKEENDQKTIEKPI